MLVGEGNYPQILPLYKERDRVGEALHEDAPCSHLWGYVPNRHRDAGRPGQAVHGLRDRHPKLPPQPWALRFVPQRSLLELRFGVVKDNETAAH